MTNDQTVEENEDTQVAVTNAIFNEIGSFGVYQKLLFVFIIYAFLSWSSLPQACIFLLSAEPAWECVQNSSVCNITGAIFPGQPNYDFRCGIPRQEWKFIDEYTSLITQFDLVCDKAAYGPNLVIITSFGGIVGAFTAGLLSDKLGRKKALFFCGFIGITTLFLLRFSPVYSMAAVLLFFQSFGIFGILACGLTVVLESVGIKERALVIGNGVWASYGFGFMIFAGVGYLLRDWKNFMMTLSFVGLPALLMYWFVPESLRWLIVKGRLKEARQTLQRIAKINRRVMKDDISLPEYKAENNKSLGDVRLLLSKGYAVYTLVLWYNNFANSMIYNSLHFIAPNLGGSLYFNWFLSGIGEIVGTLAAIFFHTRFERKKTTAVCEILTGLSAILSVILIIYDDGSQGFVVGKIIFTMLLAKCFITTAYCGVGLIVGEIYPTPVRNVAQGASMTVGCIGFAISGYVTYLVRVHYILPYAIMAVNALIAASLCLAFLKETKHIPIPDVFADDKSCYDNKAYTISGEEGMGNMACTISDENPDIKKAQTHLNARTKSKHAYWKQNTYL